MHRITSYFLFSSPATPLLCAAAAGFIGVKFRQTWQSSRTTVTPPLLRRRKNFPQRSASF
jgi:hypothetical protein